MYSRQILNFSLRVPAPNVYILSPIQLNAGQVLLWIDFVFVLGAFCCCCYFLWIDFKDIIKVPNQLILLWGNYQCGSLKSTEFSLDGCINESQRHILFDLGESNHSHCDGLWQLHGEKLQERSRRRECPRSTATRKIGTSVLQPQGNEYCPNTVSLEENLELQPIP